MTDKTPARTIEEIMAAVDAALAANANGTAKRVVEETPEQKFMKLSDAEQDRKISVIQYVNSDEYDND